MISLADVQLGIGMIPYQQMSGKMDVSYQGEYKMPPKQSMRKQDFMIKPAA